MGKVNCAVVPCTNSSYRIDRWRKEICEVREGLLHGNCGCELLFKLYCFPSKLRNSEKRARWVKATKRVKPGNSRWSSCASDRVCCVQFIDGISTANNPDPSQNLGYHGPQMKPRRTLFHHSLPSQSVMLDSDNVEEENMEIDVNDEAAVSAATTLN